MDNVLILCDVDTPRDYGTNIWGIPEADRTKLAHKSLSEVVNHYANQGYAPVSIGVGMIPGTGDMGEHGKTCILMVKK